MEITRIGELEARVAELTGLVDRLTAVTAPALSPPGVDGDIAAHVRRLTTRRGMLMMAGAAAASAMAAAVGRDVHAADAATPGVAASGVSIADAGRHYVAQNVEAALQELPSQYGFGANVLAFGAKGDGVTDDSVAIQSAIDSFGAASGGIVFLPMPPSGYTYMVSTLHLADRVHIVGAAREVTVKKIKGTGGPVFTHGTASGGGAYAAGFKNLTIDGNKANCPDGTDGIGAYPGGTRTGYRGDFNSFDNVYVINCKRHGIYIGDVTNPTYLVMMRDVWSHLNDGRGIDLVKVYDSRFLSGWTAENGTGQYLLNGCANCSFIGAQIEGSGTGSTTYPGVELIDANGTNAGIEFLGGTFTDHRKAINLTGALTDVRIIGNYFSKNNDQRIGPNSTIEITPGLKAQSGIMINSNDFSADGGSNSAIDYHLKVAAPIGTGSLTGLSVVGNLFLGTVGTNPKLGMLLMPTSGAITSLAVEGNVGAALPVGCFLSRFLFSHSASGKVQAFTFPKADSDVRGMHSTISNPERITVPETRRYRVSVSLQFADNTVGVRVVDVEKNGTYGENVMSLRHAQDSSGRWGGAGSINVLLNANDYLKLSVLQSSGGPIQVMYCYFSVEPL